MSNCRRWSWNGIHGSSKIRHGEFAFRRRSRVKSRSSKATLESLEPRVVLASDILIAEVMTSNDGTLNDEDGSSSDWFEIYNAGQEAVDLSGYHVTDQRNDLTKWQIPAANLAPGESILIFASGKNKTDPGNEYHTNFRLSDGDYLGLLAPDGRTVIDEFSTLPDQYTDVSYGVEQRLEERVWVTPGSKVRALFPSNAGEDLAAATWTSPTYDDSGWTEFTSGMGYDQDPTDGDFSPLIDANGNVSVMQGKSASAYLRTTFDLPEDALPNYQSMNLTLNYDDGFVAYLNGQRIASVSAPDTLAWDSSATAEHGGIADRLEYSDFSSADDRDDFTLKGNAQWIGDRLSLTESVANQTSAAWTTDPVDFGPDYTFSASMVFDVHSPGPPPPPLSFPDSDGLGGEGMTFVLQSNDNNVLGSGGGGMGIDDTGSTFLAIELDSTASGSFDPDDTLPSHIGISTAAGSVARAGIDRFNGNAIIAGDPPAGVNQIHLWVDYVGETTQLDVFMSTSDQKPDTPTLSATIDLVELFGGDPQLYAGWTSATSEFVNAHEVLGFDIVTGIGEIGRETELFDVSNHLKALKPGTNVLSIHGLNIDADDEDFLMVPQLTAKEIVLGESMYFSTPSPFELNGIGGLPPSAGVSFSEGSQVFVDPFTLAITPSTPGATVRYTVDGTLPGDGTSPDDTSMLYTGPIDVMGPMRIRARAFEPDRAPGPITTAGFIHLDDSLVNFENNEPFNSNLPLIIFDSFGNRRVNSDTSKLVPTVGLFIDPGEDGRAGIMDEPEYAGRAGVRIRGQSSEGWPKKQYAVEIWEEGTDDSDRLFAREVPDKDVSIFGLPADSDWVLNGPYSDKTQLNNFLTFNWFRDLGLYAPRTRLVEVFVNDSSDPDKLNYERHYRGTYVLLEKIKIGNDRVDITELEPGDTTEPDITGGYIWKKDKAGLNDRPFRTESGQELRMVEPADLPRRGVEPGPGYITDEQRDWLQNHLNEFEEVLYGPNFADPKDGYAKYIDVDSWVDTWLMVEMTKQIDGFRLSTYYHKDRGGKIKQGPAWDYNLSLGNANYLRGAYHDGWYGESISSQQYPYWGRLFQDPNFQIKVADRWQELRKGIFSTENLLADVDEAVAMLSDGNPNLENPAPGEPSNPISRNFDRWSNLGTYLWPNCFFGVDDCPRSPLPAEMSPNGRPNSYDDYIFIMKWFIEGRTEWMDQQFIPPVAISPADGIVAQGTQVTMEAPGFEIFYTLDGSDPRQPLVIEEEVTILESGAAAQVVVPTDGTLIDQCDDGNFLTTAAQCMMNPAYTPGANGETWIDATLPIGFDTDGDYDALLGTDIEASMLNTNSTAYVRVPFELDAATKADAEQVTLSVRYDDGFVAYAWFNSLRTPVEIARANAPGDAATLPINALPFDAAATQTNPDDRAIVYQDFDITDAMKYFSAGTNYITFQLLNESASSEDFLFDIRINSQTSRTEVSPSVLQYTGPVTVDQNMLITARGFKDGPREEWTGAAKALYLVDTPTLVVSEINYNPYDPTDAELAVKDFDNDDFEFIEVQNVGGSTANLVGTYFDGIEFVFPSVSLESGERGVVVRDEEAFRLRYGTDIKVLGEFGGGLNNNGERIELYDAADRLLFDLTYNDNELWPERADGRGGTLQLSVPALTPGSEANKYYHWRGSTEFGGSPGTAGAAPIGVVVNEVLAHTDGTLQRTDAIELLNTTNAPIDIGGWYLSDAAGELFKYRIPANTVLQPGGFVVFDESHFNANPNAPTSFALSGTDGDDVWLTIRDANGNPQFVDDVHFRPSLLGESFGRVPDGHGRLAPMQTLTLGTANSAPRVGPVVISEVNYNPADPTAADLAIDSTLSSGDLEFIEIHNPTAELVQLTGWRIRGGVDFNFDPEDTIKAGESLIVIRFDPTSQQNASRLAAFRNHYGMTVNTQILGGYQAQLGGDGERITLLSPDLSRIDEPITLPLVIQDEVVYDNKLPWPTDADNTGKSLHRRAADQHGNDARSWVALDPSPGQSGFSQISADFDGDGDVDATDIGVFFGQMNAAAPDLAFDFNGDGAVNETDRDQLIHGVIGTFYGDANLDRTFNSADLVAVFRAGQYEDGIAGNSTWAEGDWNGDGDFGSSDLVLAFRDGGYVAAVPTGLVDQGQRQPLRPVISALEADRVLTVESSGLTPETKAERLVEIQSAEVLLDDPQIVQRTSHARDLAMIDPTDDSELDAGELDDQLLDLLAGN